MSEEMTYSIEPYTLEIARLGLASKFEVNPDSCGNADHFREYLMYSAIQEMCIRDSYQAAPLRAILFALLLSAYI